MSAQRGKPGFAALPYELQDVCFDKAAHYVYGWLRRCSDWNTGEMRATLVEVAARSRCDIGTIRRALRILREVGAVELVGDPGKQRWKINPTRDEPHLKVREDGSSGLRGSPATGVVDYGGNGLRGSPARGVFNDTVKDAPNDNLRIAGNQHGSALEADPENVEIRSDTRSVLSVVDLGVDGDPSLDQNLRRSDRDIDRGGDLRGKQEPKTKPQAQPDLSLPAAAPTKIDPIALLRGDHDSRRDRPVLEATVALWASVWSRNPAAAVVTKDREKFWREAMKEHRPSDFAKAILGIWWDQGPADRARYHEFKHVVRDVPQFVMLYEQNGDPRDRQPFRPGCPPPKSPPPGGGRGGDRAHGGSGEVLSGQAALDKVAAETRERAERDRKQREEANSPEAKAAAEAAKAIFAERKARRAGVQ